MLYIFRKDLDQLEANQICLATIAVLFPRICTQGGFDFDAQPSSDPEMIDEMLREKISILYRSKILIIDEIGCYTTALP